MAKLDAAAVANTPVLQNLNAATGHIGSRQVGIDQLRDLFTNIAACSNPHPDHKCGFANASLPALRSLGQASLTGRPAHDRRPADGPATSTSSPSRCPSWPRTCRSSPRISTPRSAPSRPTAGARAERASPACRRCSSTRSTSRWPSTPTASSATCSRSTRSSIQDCSPYATPQRIANNLATDPQSDPAVLRLAGPEPAGHQRARSVQPGRAACPIPATPRPASASRRRDRLQAPVQAEQAA